MLLKRKKITFNAIIRIYKYHIGFETLINSRECEMDLMIHDNY